MNAPFSSLVTSGSRPSLLLRWRTTSVWFAPIEVIQGLVGSKNRTVVTLCPLQLISFRVLMVATVKPFIQAVALGYFQGFVKIFF